jgi:predicted acyltransferase
MAAAPSNRNLSLDIFRGMTVCFMIIVNTAGVESLAFGPLHHAAWNGFTPTDLVFPSFLFAVGNAMSFSMKKYEALGEGAFLSKTFRRTLLIFFIGYFMYWFPFVHKGDDGGWHLNPIQDTRIMGVLERIALCYCFASLLLHYCSYKTVYWICGGLLIGYWIILLFAVPGGTDPYGMTTNAGYYLDKWVMGEAHMYHGEGVAFDPEGILSTLPAIVNVVLGYFTGIFIQKKGKEYEGLTKLLMAGCVLMALAWFWNLEFPVNKKLWTSSFVLLTAGLDMVILSFLTYIIDFQGKTKWTSFFSVFGKNTLFIYIVSEILIEVLEMIPVGSSSFRGWLSVDVLQWGILAGPVGSLLFSLLYMMMCWAVGKWLDVKRIYIRV